MNSPTKGIKFNVNKLQSQWVLSNMDYWIIQDNYHNSENLSVTIVLH